MGERWVVTLMSNLNFVCTFFLLLSIYFRYDLLLKQNITANMYTSYDTLKTTGLWKYMVVELTLCSIAHYPFLDGIHYTEYVQDWDTVVIYELNDFMLFLAFIRLYLPYRFSFYLTEFMNPRT